jgi:hypothetical protein
MGVVDKAGRAILMGFDFPLGLPAAYARLAQIDSFRKALPDFGRGPWEGFFEVASDPREISVYRPFYPNRCPSPGACKQKYLTTTLGVNWPDLYRRCERATPERQRACPLFWTLGAKQVGKGALSGWRELLQPAIRYEAGQAALWPFDGDLDDLLSADRIVMVETYPAEAYGHLQIRFESRREGGKRSQAARRRNANALLTWALTNRISLTSGLRGAIEDGFGTTGDGEDASSSPGAVR